MITEDYISFETAKLLKENGFDEGCFALYNPDGTLIQSGIRLNNIQVGRVKGSYSAPTLQMAMKWLREVHDIYIMIDKDFATEKGWHYVVVRKQDWTNNIDNGLTQQESNSYTYEFACEAAIKYCLENLI